jgi:hypothetical protein
MTSDTGARLKAVEEAPGRFLHHYMPVAFDTPLNALVSLCGRENRIPA